jgi:hypothetical protein
MRGRDLLRETTPNEVRHGVTRPGDPRNHNANDVGRDTSSAGIAADRGHRGVFPVLPRGLSHSARPDLLHGLIVVGEAAE